MRLLPLPLVGLILAAAQPALACKNAMSAAPEASEPFLSPPLLLPAAFLLLTAAASGFLVWRLSRPAG